MQEITTFEKKTTFKKEQTTKITQYRSVVINKAVRIPLYGHVSLQ